jgi:hypothetical protein
MDLIRLLLLDTEGEESKPDLGGYTEAQLLYHVALLIEAKLVHGSIIEDGSGEIASTITTRLTWAGHEFLDAARNDTIWKKAREKIKQSGVQVTISLLEELLKKLLKESVGLP